MSEIEATGKIKKKIFFELKKEQKQQQKKVFEINWPYSSLPREPGKI